MKLKRSLKEFSDRNKGNHMNPLIILTGPTAVGKTNLSIKLAEAIGGEIISADSMQVYEYMDIGTAKISQTDMKNIPHHLINICKPWEDFNVVQFSYRAKQAMDAIYAKNKIPIIAGGTGFYIQAVLYDIHFEESNDDDSFRKEMEKILKEQGYEILHKRLQEIDPDSATAIHPNNAKRVIRALEYHHQTGNLISKHNVEERKRKSPYEFHYFVLTDDRNILYENINRRVDQMIEKGLVNEVKKLVDMGCTKQMVSMQGIGYKEILEYLDGIGTLEEAINKIKLDTRHFAKRQLTWFKREQDVEWFDKSAYGYNEDAILKEMIRRI